MTERPHIAISRFLASLALAERLPEWNSPAGEPDIRRIRPDFNERDRQHTDLSDAAGRVERHFVILPFAARWLKGEIALNEELAEAHWRKPAELADLKTTEGLAGIVAAAERVPGLR